MKKIKELKVTDDKSLNRFFGFVRYDSETFSLIFDPMKITEKDIYNKKDYRLVKFLIDNFYCDLELKNKNSIFVFFIKFNGSIVIENYINYEDYKLIYEKFYSREIQKLFKDDMPEDWIWSIYLYPFVEEIFEKAVIREFKEDKNNKIGTPVISVDSDILNYRSSAVVLEDDEHKDIRKLVEIFGQTSNLGELL